MRGSDERSGSLFSYVDLESRVPANHPLRVIRRISDEVLAGMSSGFDAAYARSRADGHASGDADAAHLDHLVGLHHERDNTNVIYPLERAEDIDRMGTLTAPQLRGGSPVVPHNANERSTREGKFGFVCRTLLSDAGAIARAVVRANWFRLLTRMPTMLAAALSVMIVLLFSAETWDVAHAVPIPQSVLFLIVSLASAVFVLYRAFAFDTLLSRDRRITEADVVTIASIFLSGMLTLLAMFMLFGGLMYLVIGTVFPER